MSYDLYVWSDRHDLEPEEAMARVDAWVDAGADPAAGPFEPSTDVAWFFRELTKELPDLDAVGRADPSGHPSGCRPGGCQLVARSLRGRSDDLDAILALPRSTTSPLRPPRSAHQPALEMMAEHATAMFGPEARSRPCRRRRPGIAVSAVPHPVPSHRDGRGFGAWRVHVHPRGQAHARSTLSRPGRNDRGVTGSS
jgi:hypothetical protein